MAGGAAGDVVDVRPLPAARVAVGGGEEHQHLLALAQRTPPQFDRPGGGAEEGLHRALEADRLLEGGAGQGRVGPQPGVLLGEAGQAPKGGADAVDRGVEPGREQRADQHRRLLRRQLPGTGRGMDAAPKLPAPGSPAGIAPSHRRGAGRRRPAPGGAVVVGPKALKVTAAKGSRCSRPSGRTPSASGKTASGKASRGRGWRRSCGGPAAPRPFVRPRGEIPRSRFIAAGESTRFSTARARVCSGGSRSSTRLGERHGVSLGEILQPDAAGGDKACQSLKTAVTSCHLATPQQPRCRSRTTGPASRSRSCSGKGSSKKATEKGSRSEAGASVVLMALPPPADLGAAPLARFARAAGEGN